MVLSLEVAVGRLRTPINLSRFFENRSSVRSPIKSIAGFTHPVKGPLKTQLTNQGQLGSPTGLKRVTITMSYGPQCVITGKTIKISGKTDWKRVANDLSSLVPEIASTGFEVSTRSYTINMGHSINLAKLSNEAQKNPGPFGLTKIKMPDPDINPTIRYLGMTVHDDTSLLMYANGTIIINTKNEDADENTLRGACIEILGFYLKGSVPKNLPAVLQNVPLPLPARKNLKKKRENMAESRYPLALGPGTPNKGYYVRPGPNKKLRVYKIPANPAYVRAKVLKAYQEAGIAVPAHVKRLLGVQVKSPSPVRPKNTSPAGYYRRPGPDGTLKLYKIPKGIKAGRETVLKSYAKAGTRIPTPVRTIFGISKSPSPIKKSPSPPKVTGNVTKRGVFRVGGKDCRRWTLEELQMVARSQNVAYNKLTKAKLCSVLQKKLVGGAPASAQRPNFRIGNVDYFLNKAGQKVRKGQESRSKALGSFKLAELQNFARAKRVSNTGTKAAIISRLTSKTPSPSSASSLGSLQSLANLLAKSPSPSPAKSPAKKSPSPSPSPVRRLVKMARANTEEL
jgi:hypothetical protein